LEIGKKSHRKDRLRPPAQEAVGNRKTKVVAYSSRKERSFCLCSNFTAEKEKIYSRNERRVFSAEKRKDLTAERREEFFVCLFSLLSFL